MQNNSSENTPRTSFNLQLHLANIPLKSESLAIYLPVLARVPDPLLATQDPATRTNCIMLMLSFQSKLQTLLESPLFVSDLSFHAET